MRVTSGSWDGEKVFLPNQVLDSDRALFGSGNPFENFFPILRYHNSPSAFVIDYRPTWTANGKRLRCTTTLRPPMYSAVTTMSGTLFRFAGSPPRFRASMVNARSIFALLDMQALGAASSRFRSLQVRGLASALTLSGLYGSLDFVRIRLMALALGLRRFCEFCPLRIQPPFTICDRLRRCSVIDYRRDRSPSGSVSYGIEVRLRSRSTSTLRSIS
jgi:hypothetical protein